MTTTQNADTDLIDETNWAIDYDVAPIRVRDPVAEALGVLEPGDPFEISYRDVVKIAGHSCPTAAGAFRVAQTGLDALYPDELPVRSDVEVLVGGSKDDAAYGVSAHLISYITGAAAEDGFGGLAGEYGGRKELLEYDEFGGADVTFAFRRTDTDDAVEVTYRVGEIPSLGPEGQYLQRIIDGTASEKERNAFNRAWHNRVQAVLDRDDLFEVGSTSAFAMR